VTDGRLYEEAANEIERLREFACQVYARKDSSAAMHDRAAQLLDVPSLAHGMWDWEQSNEVEVSDE